MSVCSFVVQQTLSNSVTLIRTWRQGSYHWVEKIIYTRISLNFISKNDDILRRVIDIQIGMDWKRKLDIVL